MNMSCMLSYNWCPMLFKSSSTLVKYLIHSSALLPRKYPHILCFKSCILQSFTEHIRAGIYTQIRPLSFIRSHEISSNKTVPHYFRVHIAYTNQMWHHSDDSYETVNRIPGEFFSGSQLPRRFFVDVIVIAIDSGCMTILFLKLHITRSDITPHIKWAVCLVIAYGHFIVPRGFVRVCIWVNILILSPPRDNLSMTFYKSIFQTSLIVKQGAALHFVGFDSSLTYTEIVHFLPHNSLLSGSEVHDL